MDLATTDVKWCPGCGAHKPRQEFHRDRRARDGCFHICKVCQCAAQRVRKANANPPPTPTTSDMSDDEPTLPYADTGGTTDALYLMRYDFDPGAIKIGRAADVTARALQLETSHNFRMLVLATFPGQGHVEQRVHSSLAHARLSQGRGREWFAVSLDTALHAVALALASAGS